jgi:hypothetical protein
MSARYEGVVKFGAFCVVVRGLDGERMFVSDPAPTRGDAQIMLGLLDQAQQRRAEVRQVVAEFGTADLFEAWQRAWAS